MSILQSLQVLVSDVETLSQGGKVTRVILDAKAWKALAGELAGETELDAESALVYGLLVHKSRLPENQ